MLLDAAAQHAPTGKRRRRGTLRDLAAMAGGRKGKDAVEVEVEGDWTGGRKV